MNKKINIQEQVSTPTNVHNTNSQKTANSSNDKKVK